MPQTHDYIKRTKLNRKMDTLDKLALCVAFIEPLSTIPQIIKIFSTKQTAGLSLATWILFACGASIWFLYGLKIKNKQVSISGFLWVIMELVVVMGILLYG